MKTRHPILLALGGLAAFLVLLTGSPVWACRIIVPPWPPHPPHPPVEPPPRLAVQGMEVKHHQVSVEIDGPVARVVVDATFHNPNASRIEGTYLFPIGRRAVVSSFAMSINGKVQEAELLEAEKARGIYESIVRQLKDPALLEYLEDGLLKARVFPIEPHADVKVQLVYEEALVRDGDLTRFTYPLLAAKPDPGLAIGKLSIDLRIKTRSPLKTLYTPGFETKIERGGDNAAHITHESSGHIPARDFQVVFGEDRRQVGIDFLAAEKNGESYFMMVMAPGSELQMEEIARKDVIFVVDTSGSMAGEKIAQARAALEFCVENLRDGDRFNLVAFATDVVPMAAESLPVAAATRQQAAEFIAGLKPRGGTAIADALAFAAGTRVADGHVGMTIFVTDGLPTIGETAPEKILAGAAADAMRRVYTFGVGYDVNTRLLDGLAARCGGAASYVRPKEDLEVALSNFYEKVAYPVLTDLKIDAGEVKLTEVNPKSLPGLFKGGQLVVTGKFLGQGKHRMTLSGEIGGRREQFPFEADLKPEPANLFIPRLWAMSQVAYLQEQIRINGRRDELVDEIKRLGRQYAILTEYTSFLIVEEGMEADRVDAARRSFGRVEAASQADTGDAAFESARMGSRMKGGWALSAPAPEAAARESAVLDQTYRAAGIPLEKLADLVRPMSDKTFYFRRSDSVWYDSELAAGETPDADIEVAAWSDDFFKLLRKHPALARYVLGGDARQMIKLDGLVIFVK